MHQIHRYLLSKGCYLWLGLIGLVLAIYNPKIMLSENIYNYMFVVDITQSMNVTDMQTNGLATSRLDYTVGLVGEILKQLPCGSKVSIALFANAEIVPLYTPIEVCDNFGVIHESLSHIEWRMAWRGSSHLRLGLLDAGRLMLELNESVQMVFFTDGDEAAPINAITKVDLMPMQGSAGWLLVGIGSQKLSPVPKLNSKNNIIGYWSQYATKIEPSQIVNEDSLGKRDDSIASDPHEYYLSGLREAYMKEIAGDIGASYIRASTKENVVGKIKQLPAAGYGDSNVPLGWLFAVMSCLCVMTECAAKRALQ